eukprot:398469-Prymnesium_polylepis.1
MNSGRTKSRRPRAPLEVPLLDGARDVGVGGVLCAQGAFGECCRSLGRSVALEADPTWALT